MNFSASKRNEKPPFLSVCVDITNRSKTIKKTITCILNQTCQDFELIISDHESRDISLEIAKKIIDQHRKINVKFALEKQKRTEVEEWNTPLLVAQGDYIAVCEGDDYFSSMHLETAKRYLQLNENIGLYEVASSTLGNMSLESITLQKSADSILELRCLQWCPVPSAVILKRLGRTSQRYLYDPKNVYAGEYKLYDQILSEKYDVLRNLSFNYVERGFRFYLKTEFHMRDVIEYYEEIKASLNPNQKAIAEREICDIASLYFCWNLAKFRYNRDLAQLFLKYSSNYFMLSIRLIKGLQHVIKAEFFRVISRLAKLLNA
jgi:glycosyltransferase involved in cell wall biosynthesis